MLKKPLSTRVFIKSLSFHLQPLFSHNTLFIRDVLPKLLKTIDMKKSLFVLTILLFSGISPIFAQLGPSQILERFFNKYRYNPEEAVAFIFSKNPIFEGEAAQQAQNVQTKLSQAIPVLGRYYGREPITKKEIGSSLVLYSYLIQYERQPIRFTFKFYKPDREWFLLSFAFDDNLSDELEEAARIPNLLLSEKNKVNGNKR
jgi:hypothetical protein